MLSQSAPGSVRAALPPHPPEQPEDFAAMLADIDRVVLPGRHPLAVAVVLRLLPGQLLRAGGPRRAALRRPRRAGDALGHVSPARTELETHVLDWLVELLGLPDAFRSDGAGGGVIQDSASSASLVAMVAARERATAGAANRSGVRHGLVAYASSQAHSSIEKAARIAGLGSREPARRRRRRPHPRHGPEPPSTG